MNMPDDPIQQVVERLKSDRESERLSAAREILQREPIAPATERAVRTAFAREAVPWVRGALAEVLAATDGVDWDAGIDVPAPSWDSELDGLDPDVARQLIHTSTRRVLHEVADVVGRARLAAAADLDESYSGSETKRELDFLAEVCGGLRTLSAATQAPQLIEFDLAAELSQQAEAVSQDRLCPINCDGPAPFIVISDRGLIRLAVQNVLINAIEATLAIGAADLGRAVVLTWGISPVGLHVTVIDRGPGPPRFLAAVRNAGVSTKEGHPGYGLATASEALRSLAGTVQIRRNDRGGATVVLAWSEGS